MARIGGQRQAGRGNRRHFPPCNSNSDKTERQLRSSRVSQWRNALARRKYEWEERRDQGDNSIAFKKSPKVHWLRACNMYELLGVLSVSNFTICLKRVQKGDWIGVETNLMPSNWHPSLRRRRLPRPQPRRYRRGVWACGRSTS